ncbi:50S ribosomal protein L6 [Candidatus Woesearchaeota archaeon]|nr:50S ribosomal protein L6 [Candidatus Woesearchaeota archaeon]
MGRKKIKMLKEEIGLVKGVTASYDGSTFSMKGPKGEASKIIRSKMATITIEGGKVIIAGKKFTKREKTEIGSITAHIKNLQRGVTEGHIYRLKICSGHFPMNVSLSKGEIVIKNFLGEKFPRVLKIKQGANVKIDGQEIIVEGTSKETCGHVAADIEKLTSVSGRDLRVFQDGIYITEKDGKMIK